MSTTNTVYDEYEPIASFFDPPPPFNEKYQFAIKMQRKNKPLAVIGLFVSANDFPTIMVERRYNECLKANRILSHLEYQAIVNENLLPELASEAKNRARGPEPTPPTNALRTAGHHWLDDYDSDGHYFGCVVLQWNPGAMRWSHSGNVGAGLYVDTAYWRYVAPCSIPE